MLLEGRYRIISQLGQGGFGSTWKVDDQGIIKALKVLELDYQIPKVAKLFQQEATILSQLQHPGIPKVEPDGFFHCKLAEYPQPIRCLVMELIQGCNLQAWMQQHSHQPISQTLAIAWLRQLLDILDAVHSQNFFHRDIKPSNIMLKPDGQLVLIDFGIARSTTTDTYAQKLRGEGDVAGTVGTNFVSRGYSAPEQVYGAARPVSDFYSLGRTFVFFFTGRDPIQHHWNDDTETLLWRENAPQISQSLADVIDWCMNVSVKQRPQTVQDILERLDQIEVNGDFSPASIATLPLQNQVAPDASSTTLLPPTPSNHQRQLPLIVAWSVLVASSVVGIRLLGWLQPLELPAFDLILRSRPPEQADSRLLIVSIDHPDLEWQKQQGMAMTVPEQSLADQALAQLLTRLTQYQPRVIGLDMYRDFKTSNPKLKEQLQQLPNLIAMCNTQDSSNPNLIDRGHPPPPEVPTENLGFNDFLSDLDRRLRRQILFINPEVNSPCQAPYAFSTKISLSYFEKLGLKVDFVNKNLRINSTIFTNLSNHVGGYHRIDDTGAQVLLNYRALRHPNAIATQIPLRQFLTEKTDPNLVRDRIVLIGVVNHPEDQWSTPYTVDQATQVSGVVVHAHMISQLLSAVLDGRSLLWTLPQWADVFWIISWSIIGGGIGWGMGRPLWVGIGTVVVLVILSGSCWGGMVIGLWLPLVPSAIAIVMTISSISVYKMMQDQTSQLTMVDNRN